MKGKEKFPNAEASGRKEQIDRIYNRIVQVFEEEDCTLRESWTILGCVRDTFGCILSIDFKYGG